MRGSGGREVSAGGASGMLPVVPFVSWLCFTPLCSYGENAHNLGTFLVVYMYSSMKKFPLMPAISQDPWGKYLKTFFLNGHVHFNFRYKPLQTFVVFLV